MNYVTSLSYVNKQLEIKWLNGKYQSFVQPCLVKTKNLLPKIWNFYLCTTIFLLNLQMNYILTRKNFPKPLLENLPQRNTALCDLKLVFDHGEVWIHRTVLQMWCGRCGGPVCCKTPRPTLCCCQVSPRWRWSIFFQMFIEEN